MRTIVITEEEREAFEVIRELSYDSDSESWELGRVKGTNLLVAEETKREYVAYCETGRVLVYVDGEWVKEEEEVDEDIDWDNVEWIGAVNLIKDADDDLEYVVSY